MREPTTYFLKKLSFYPQINKVFFFQTKIEKINWINNNYHLCIDDLEDILESITIKKILFNPLKQPSIFTSLYDWKSITETLPILLNTDRTCFIKDFSQKPQRLQRELEILKLSKDCKTFKAPSIVGHTQEFLVTKKLNLNEVNDLDFSLLSKIFLFLEEFDKLKIPFPATHSVKSISDYKKQIEQRFLKVKSPSKNLRTLYEKVLNKKNSAKVYYLESNCFPDFFKKNFHLNNFNELVLTDFESVGKDDPARTYLNCIHHLGHELTKEEAKLVTQFFYKYYGEKFWNNVKAYSDLNAFEWILIGSNRLNSSSPCSLVENKVNMMLENISQKKETWSWQEDKLYLSNEFFKN